MQASLQVSIRFCMVKFWDTLLLVLWQGFFEKNGTSGTTLKWKLKNNCFWPNLSNPRPWHNFFSGSPPCPYSFMVGLLLISTQENNESWECMNAAQSSLWLEIGIHFVLLMIAGSKERLCLHLLKNNKKTFFSEGLFRLKNLIVEQQSSSIQ